MESAPEIAALVHDWLARYRAARPPQTPAVPYAASRPDDPSALVPALAALAAEALAHDRTLWIVSADDVLLPDISNALDLCLRPLCLVLPDADYAGNIALRATLALLKSRLTRAAADSNGPAWNTMRARLERDDTLWRDCLAWSARGNDHEPPPAGVGSLFPVRIGPWMRAERLAAPADWVMLVQAQRFPADRRVAWPGACCTLLLDDAPCPGAAHLATVDAAARLRAELDVLGQELAEMELEFATAQGELVAFSTDYHARIAWRIAELDRVQADLTELRLRQAPDDVRLQDAAREAGSRAEHSAQERTSPADEKTAEPAGFAPSNELKKRFRQLAQKIHPDRARDETDRAWRTQLMSEANRAYRAGDAAALDEVLALWFEGRHATCPSRGAVLPGPTFDATERLAAEVVRVRRRIAAIAAALDRLYGSKLYELFAAARIATRRGRDLLAEMAERFDNQITQAKAELERQAGAVSL